ncbi:MULTISPECIES: Ig-like domain-containing protein [Thalassolituus]|uniref:Ig-like domain-containing protein n=5 Tax=Oceanospirillaceae TaxID=135620 RepID=UPI0026479FA0|nr:MULTISPECIES: Ig-like domain-containing protein [Thalassolituus]|tara:strand:- start:21172 stop:27831 length:6660 start_codon:yes stop_codon:yes gene_type:complete
MDNNPNKKRPGTSAPLKAIAPVIAMAVPFSAPFSASMANASSRLASVSRNGLNKRAVVSQVEQYRRPEAAGAFSAFGGVANARAVSRTVDQDALAFLASNDLLSVGDERVGYESGDLDDLTGRKNFLSCTKSGAPYYFPGGTFPITTSFFCTSLYSANWIPGQDEQPPHFKDGIGQETLVDMTILPGNSDSQLFEMADKNLSSISLTAASSNQAAVRDADITITRDAVAIDTYTIAINNVVGGGGATITVTATDGNGNSRSDTFFIDTGVAPDPLEMTGGDSAVSLMILEDAGLTALSAADFAAATGATGTLSWSASGATKGTASATGSVSAPTTGASPTSVTYAPNANATGSDTFTVTVNDGSATDSRAVNVTITPVNDAPTLIVPSTQRVSGTGGSQRSIPGYATAQPGGGSDEAGQTFTYSVVETLDENNVVSGVSITSTGELRFTPAVDAEGYAYYSVTVTDSGGTANGGVDTSAPIVVTLSIDTLAPELTLNTPVASPTTDHRPEVTYSSNEAGYLSGGGSCGVADAGLKTPGTYTVRLTQTDNTTPLADGTYSDCTLIVEDTNGNATTLPLGTFVVTSDLTPPTVTSVDVPTNGTYGVGDVLSFTVNTDEAVNVSGSPAINMMIGGTPRKVTYSSGSGSQSLVFSTTVAVGDLDTDGIEVLSLTLDGGTLTDAAGNAMDLTLNGRGPTAGILVDGVAPVVSSVTVPAAGTYAVGDVLAFTVTASEALTISGGTPSLELVVGSTVRQASMVSASGTDMTFTYTVTAGDLDSDGISVNNLVANGATLQDAAGNDLALGVGAVDSSGVLVDAVVPVVTSVAVPADGLYSEGGTFDFTVNLSEPVTTTGARPVLNLNIGGQLREAALLDGNGTAAHVFRYAVQPGDEDSDGIEVLTMDLKGSTAVDAAGNGLNTALNNVATTTGITVDAVVPVISVINTSATATIPAGGTHDFILRFSEDVTLNTTGGSPRIALDVGGEIRYATAPTSFSGVFATFTYTALAGDVDTDGISMTAIEPNGGYFADAAGNRVDLTSYVTPDTSNLKVDAIPPSISGLEVTAPNHAKAGDEITVTLVADKVITLGNGGIPAIKLQVGSREVDALYRTGSGTQRFDFTYTVVDGDNDGDGFAINSLAMNAAVIEDSAGNALDTTLPSLPDTSAYKVDTTAPALQSFRRHNPVDEVTSSDSLTWRVEFNEAVSGVMPTSFSVSGTTATVVTAKITDTTYDVTVTGGDLSALDGTVGLNLAATSGITDLAGNALPATEPATDETYTVDNTAPAVNIQAPSATLTSSTAITYVVQYTDADSISLSADDIAVTSTGDAAAGTITVTGSGPMSRTVTLSDFSGDGTLAIDIAAGTAEDGAGNASAAPATSDAFTVDTTRPTVSITAPTASPDPFDITVTFSESVSDFVVGDITIAGGSLSEFAGSGTTYTAKVTPNVVGSPVNLSIAADVAEDAATNGNEASASVSVDTNNVPTIAISGDEIEGQTLAAQLSDSDGVSGAVTYDWVSDGNSVGNAETYTLQASDVGNQLSVNAVYTDDAGYAENVTSALTGVIISIEQNAWNNIGDSVGSPSTPASFDDYGNVGLSGPSDDELNRIMSILNRAVSQQAAVTDIDELSELEALVDTIMEGQDDDKDGLPNLVEDDGLKDTDRDGIDDRDDVDADNDGIRDNLEVDALGAMDDDDADGIVNLFDFDQDGDGYPDSRDFSDANLDGVIDEFDTLEELVDYFAADATGTPVAPGAVSGAASVLAARNAEVDTDGDGLINSLDIDSDNDSVPDVIEAGLSDSNDDALVDDGTALIEDANDLPDTDSDSRADFLQLLSNGTDPDISQSAVFTATMVAALDQDGDGQLDSTTDVDLDGLMDVVDNAIGAFGSAKDFDGDGIPNHLDPDDDNDNISDIEENAELAQFFTGEDADGDGIDDGFDAEINGVTYGTDTNNNGVRDDRELPDLDGDGLVDYLDDDADNDGIHDSVDDDISLPVDPGPGNGQAPGNNDADGDGVDDDVDASVNSDNDVEVSTGVGSAGLATLFALGLVLVAVRRKPILAATLPLLLAAQAVKAENDNNHWSIGTAVGLSKYDTNIVGPGLELTDREGLGFQLNAGYHLNSELSAEVALTELGDAGVGTGWVSYQSQAIFLGYRPEAIQYSGFRPQVKVGVNRMEYEGHKGLNIDKESATMPAWSLGVDYPLGREGYVELMFTAFSEEVNFYSVGFRQRF